MLLYTVPDPCGSKLLRTGAVYLSIHLSVYTSGPKAGVVYILGVLGDQCNQHVKNRSHWHILAADFKSVKRLRQLWQKQPLVSP